MSSTHIFQAIISENSRWKKTDRDRKKYLKIFVDKIQRRYYVNGIKILLSLFWGGSSSKVRLCRHCGGAVSVILPFGEFPAEARCIYCGRADRELEDALNESYKKRHPPPPGKETPHLRRMR